MGAFVSYRDSAVCIDSVIPGFTLEKAGVQKGDILLMLNGKRMVNDDAYYSEATVLRTGDEVEVQYRRGKKIITRKTLAVMKPYEVNPYADITYDWVSFKQGALRVITKRPKGKTNCPAVLFIPGYNCSSVENFPNNYNGWLMNEWLKAGYAVVCIEKSGTGDSYGCLPCTEVDMQTDIESFSLGYEYMQRLEFVDRDRLFIWGHSMGGVIAPVLARKYQPRGVMAFATVFRPWSEFLLEMHRIQYPLDGKSYTETEDLVRLLHKVYYEFFVLKKAPAELYTYPEYTSIVAAELGYVTGSSDMWGRHWRFWQQIDSLNLAADWSKVEGKVLSIFGGMDFIQCSELEQKLIVETVNKSHPGNATYLRIDDIDHLMTVHTSWQEAHDMLYDVQYRNTHFSPTIARQTLDWMNAVCR